VHEGFITVVVGKTFSCKPVARIHIVLRRIYAAIICRAQMIAPVLLLCAGQNDRSRERTARPDPCVLHHLHNSFMPV
jgi:hypothetical protein